MSRREAFHCGVVVRLSLDTLWSDLPPWNTSSLVADLDSDVFLPFYDNDFDCRIVILILDAVPFYHSSKRVLEQLKEHVLENQTSVHRSGGRISSSILTLRWLGTYLKREKAGVSD
jgi:hypothetical protein